MSNTYSVVITGELVEGFDLELVKQSFAELFKLSDDKVSNYFSGKPKVLKRALEYKTAIKYKQRIELAGAIVELRELSLNVAPAKTESQTPTRAQTQVETQVETQAKTTAQPKIESESKDIEKSVIEYDDSSMNAIEAGRMKKIQKMENVELAEESRSKTFMLLGAICILIAVAAASVESFNFMAFSGGIWIAVSSALVGLAFLKSSNAS